MFRTRLITIDIDWKEKPLYQRLIIALRLKWICNNQNIECNIKRSHKGYHVRIILKNPVEYSRTFPVRALLGDDEERLFYETVKYAMGIYHECNTLFSAKYIGRRLEYIEEKTSIEEVVRNALRLPIPL